MPETPKKTQSKINLDCESIPQEKFYEIIEKLRDCSAEGLTDEERELISTCPLQYKRFLDIDKKVRGDLQKERAGFNIDTFLFNLSQAGIDPSKYFGPTYWPAGAWDTFVENAKEAGLTDEQINELLELKFIEQFIEDYQILNGTLIDSSQCVQKKDTINDDGNADITSLFKDCANLALQGPNGEIIPLASINNSEYGTVEIKGDDNNTEELTSLYTDSDCTGIDFDIINRASTILGDNEELAEEYFGGGEFSFDDPTDDLTIRPHTIEEIESLIDGRTTDQEINFDPDFWKAANPDQILGPFDNHYWDPLSMTDPDGPKLLPLGVIPNVFYDPYNGKLTVTYSNDRFDEVNHSPDDYLRFAEYLNGLPKESFDNNNNYTPQTLPVPDYIELNTKVPYVAPEIDFGVINEQLLLNNQQ